MHIPDGYLGPATYGTCWAAMLPIWGYASRKVRETVKPAEIPYLAMATVFSLMAMMFVLPIPGGTTGHISGTTLAHGAGTGSFRSLCFDCFMDNGQRRPRSYRRKWIL
jgi:ABC-type Co2+ transport system permease subunit